MANDSPPDHPTEHFRFPVDATAVMLFARALGDDTPASTDIDHPDSADGLVPSPTFYQSSAQHEPDYPLDTLRSGWKQKVTPRYPGEGRTLHGEQRFVYHHPVRSGDVMDVTIRIGEQWRKESSRGGALDFVEQITEFRNQDGVLCVTAVNTGVIPENKPGSDS